MKPILRYLKPFAGIMAVGFTIKFVATIAELFLPAILRYILSDVVGLESIPMILLWGGIMIFFATVAVICNVIANRMAARVARDSTVKMRHDLFAHIMRLSASQTDKFTIPSLESRVTTDTYNVYNFINSIQRIGVRAPLLLFGGLAFTLAIDPMLTLVMFAVMPLIFVTVGVISSKGIRCTEPFRDRRTR